jgi:AcrR family transcriptional regulator
MRQDVLDKTHSDPAGTAARILNAAEVVFAEHGFAGTSTREIARRAGVPFGALHYHWGSKKELWEAVFRRVTDRTRETILATFTPGGTLGELIDNLVDAFFDFFAAHRDVTRLCYRTALEPRDPHLATVHAMFRDLEQLGLGIHAALAPGARHDVRVTIFIVANAFIAAIADEPSQETFLGGSVFVAGPPRERLRTELKRVARAIFGAPTDAPGGTP